MYVCSINPGGQLVDFDISDPEHANLRMLGVYRYYDNKILSRDPAVRNDAANTDVGVPFLAWQLLLYFGHFSTTAEWVIE